MIYIKAKFALHGFELNVDLSLPSHGITAISGSSGSGKTSLFNIISGLLKTNMADIKINGLVYQQKNFILPIRKRQLAYVYQHPYLFPHLSIERNLQYAYTRIAFRKDIMPYNNIIDLLDVGPLLQQHPNKLSGGQLQRSSIAQALLSHPSMLLMDEPFSALDATYKQGLMLRLKKYLHNEQIPTIYITHFDNEIINFADRVVLFESGRCIKTLDLKAFINQKMNKIIKSIQKNNDGYKLILDDGQTINLSQEQLKIIKNI